MKSVDIFHSYNYINSKVYLKDNKIFNLNNELIVIILNAPKNNSLYNLKIKKNLLKKNFSKKNTQMYYYTKNNIKIYVTLNCSKLYSLLLHNKTIPDKEILFKLLKDNYIVEINNKRLLDIICLNKCFKKNLDFLNNNDTLSFNNSNIIHFFNINIDIKNEAFTLKNKNNIINKNINGGILLHNSNKLCLEEITNFILKHNKNALIISENKWEEIDLVKVIDYSSIKNKYNLIKKCYYLIIDYNNLNDNFDKDVLLLIKSINYKKLIFISNKLDIITTDTLLNIYKTYYDVDLSHYYKTDQLFFSLSKNVYFRDYKVDIIKKNKIKLENIYINEIIKEKPNFLIEKYKTHQCPICLEDISKNNLVKTKCNHYYCLNCLKKSINLYNNCPLCKIKLSNKSYYKVIDSLKDIKYNISKYENNILNLCLTKQNLFIFDSKKVYYKFKYIIDILDIHKINFKYKVLKNKENINEIPFIKNNLNLFLFTDINKLSFDNLYDKKKIVIVKLFNYLDFKIII